MITPTPECFTVTSPPAQSYALAAGPHDAPVCACGGERAGSPASCEIADDPRYCWCRECGRSYRTPIHHVLGHLASVAETWGLSLRVQTGEVTREDAAIELQAIIDRFGVETP